jgi:carbon-monoxide dehydrogenase small subunit
LKRHPDIGGAALTDILSSNLCRCTGYQNILKAVRMAAMDMRECSRSPDVPGNTFWS